ncbi:MAG: hypothetical protein CM15mP12_3310 [Gammaproteobacteria bacterium]|nr:MAG: hypothetical protein CM15mP12_3310 [Gammaproteobacteria bacterium]
MDTAIKFEGRLRTLDTQPDRVLSSESKPLLVDSFVKYKIAWTLKHFIHQLMEGKTGLPKILYRDESGIN